MSCYCKGFSTLRVVDFGRLRLERFDFIGISLLYARSKLSPDKGWSILVHDVNSDIGRESGMA